MIKGSLLLSAPIIKHFQAKSPVCFGPKFDGFGAPFYRFLPLYIHWGRGPIWNRKYLRLRCPQIYKNLGDCSRGRARPVGGRFPISDEGKLRGKGEVETLTPHISPEGGRGASIFLLVGPAGAYLSSKHAVPPVTGRGRRIFQRNFA